MIDTPKHALPPEGVPRARLLAACDALLEPARFHDYGPNGLQVQGKALVSKVVCGVTASRALIEAAVNKKADALLVHHGLFWRGQDGTITGWMKERLALLLAHDINLIAYHLPLDAHPLVGNNAQLAKRFGLTLEGNFGDYELGCIGKRQASAAFKDTDELVSVVTQALGKAPLVLGQVDGPIERIAWCSGGAQGWFEAAIAAGAQAFITGEISEQHTHLARECNTVFLACGHHATERFGIQALTAHICSELALDYEYVEIDNPV